MPNVDPKAFWENKILTWETGRYEDTRSAGSVLESIANRASDSLRNRIQLAGDALAPVVAGKRVAEIGCGSALLAERLIDAGAVHYDGYDIAEAAIANARTQNATLIDAGKASFFVQSIDDMPRLNADIVFSLGLLDWLRDDEIATLFEKTGGAEYLHAIAERRFSLQRILHRAYVFVSYGHKTGGYVPRYFTPQEIKTLADRSAPRDAYVFRTPLLSFGAFVSSFPFDNTDKVDN